MNKVNFVTMMLLLVIGIFCISACTNNQEPSNETIPAADSEPKSSIEQGEYLVKIMGCNDCHSPKRMGPKGPEIIPELMLSGYPSDRQILEFKDPLLKEGFATFYPDLTAAAGP